MLYYDICICNNTLLATEIKALYYKSSGTAVEYYFILWSLRYGGYKGFMCEMYQPI
jgi:hypothetical protein